MRSIFRKKGRDMKTSCLILCLLLGIVLTFVRARTYGGCPKRCPPCLQAVKSKCLYEEKDFCSCCSHCLKSEGDICGGQNGALGKCQRSLFCDKSGIKGSLLENQAGVCRERYPKPYICPAIACDPKDSCKSRHCPYGTAFMPCGCCPKCAQGLREQCNKYGLQCGNGLFCHEVLHPSAKTVNGICLSWMPFSFLQQ